MISCDEVLFAVTANLHWTLKRIRLPNLSRIVWADAICINQDDLDKKGNQVSMMGRIFSSASKVLAFAGDAGVQTAENVVSIIGQYKNTESQDEFLNVPDGDPLWDDRRMRAISDLMSRPWFTRAWILQEVCLATEP